MTKRIIALSALLALLPAERAGAEEDAPGVPAPLAREVRARAAERGVPAAQALAPVVEAARRGIPADLVADKVLEGLAKGVPPERIASVARALADRLGAAESLLGEAGRQKLAPAADRRSALVDLAAALGAGVSVPAVESLVAAAHAARGGSSGSVVSAALVLGELAHRGVTPSEAMPLALAIARTGPRPPAEIPALFDSWRAEGGKDPRAFLAEAARRIESGRTLDRMVDVFGESPSRVVRDREAAGKDREGLIGSDVGKRGADQGLGPAERPDAARGAVPGLDDTVRKQGKGPKGRK